MPDPLGQPWTGDAEVGPQHILNEVHVAGADGYQLPGAAKKPHTHEQVKVS
jgi:hypothetical protein